jgi:pimeloyl-ACP methyl ester carboxylesterase
MRKTTHKRTLFDEDATYLPPRNRTFTMKTSSQETDHLLSTLRGRAITDKTGLERAYEQGDAYAHGDTLYIAGSHTARDWFDDVTKIPAWGDLRNAERYREAEKALKANPNITRVVGHSLGGSVALELQKNNPALESRTYGAPVWDPLGQDGKVDRYRNWFDPVSVLDRSASRSFKGNPFDSFSMTHDYGNIATKFQSGGSDNANGWRNQDGTVSLVQ